MRLHQYQIVGRHKPGGLAGDHPEAYRMKIFAPNAVMARSRFWYFISKLKRIKRANGEILSMNEIFEKKPTTIKNYGVWVRYRSRTDPINMYKEYRDTTQNGAIEQMYTEMASRHRARFAAIHVIKIQEIKASEARRVNMKQYIDSKIKFPLPHRVLRPTHMRYKTTFKATRPNTFF